MLDVGAKVQIPYTSDLHELSWIDAVISAWVDYPSEDGYYRVYECAVQEGNTSVTVSKNLIRKA